MSDIFVGVIGFVVLFTLVFLGLPVGFALIMVGFVGILYFMPWTPAFLQLATVPFFNLANYDLIVIPLFLLMAQVVFVSGLGEDLYNLAARWLGHYRGGLAMATTAGCAVFAAASASSIATAATMCAVAYPEMKRHKYASTLSTGSIAAGGTIGILIPPSAVFILYGIITQTSIGKLFMAGIIPGITEALFYIVTIFLLCTWNPSLGPPGRKFSFKEKMAGFRSCGEIIALIVVVLGGLMIGWFTPTEAGAVGAFGAILFCTIRRRLNWQKFMNALLDTMKTTGMAFLLLIGAFLFQRFVALSGLPVALANVVGGLPVPPLVIIAGIMVVYLALGCIMTAATMILVTIPVFLPLVMDLGFSLIWFGVLIVRAAEVAAITPPIGINTYVIAGAVSDDMPMSTVFRGVFPFVVADILHIALLVLVPALSLWLPSIL